MTILNTETISGSGGSALVVVLVLLILSMLCVVISGYAKDDSTSVLGGMIVIFVCFIIMIALILDHKLEYYTEYTVIFDDENPITAQQFLEQYEVLEVDGKIYTIRNRINNDSD